MSLDYYQVRLHMHAFRVDISVLVSQCIKDSGRESASNQTMGESVAGGNGGPYPSNENISFIKQ